MSNLQLELKIDIHSLDKLWENLPAETRVWGQALADSILELHQAELELTTTRARIDKQVRDNLAKYTETQVKNLVDSHPDVISAETKVITCEHNKTVTKAIVDSLDTKRSSLKYLTELVMIGYTSK